MNAQERKEYWIKVERLRKQLDDKYSSLFKEAILKDLSQFADDVLKMEPQAALSMMGSYAWNDEIMTIMGKLYKEAAVLFGNAVYRAVRNMSQKAANPFGLNDEWVTAIVRYLSQYGFTLVAEMTQTTKDKLRRLVAAAIEEGMTNEEIARMIMKENGYAKFRANRIARTEVMRATNYATMVGAQSHNFEVDKIWIASRDRRTRRIPRNAFDHYHMDGQQVGYDEPFLSQDIEGRIIAAQFPGDATTPAGFTINCRCTVGFMPRRDANGRLILKQ